MEAHHQKCLSIILCENWPSPGLWIENGAQSSGIPTSGCLCSKARLWRPTTKSAPQLLYVRIGCRQVCETKMKLNVVEYPPVDVFVPRLDCGGLPPKVPQNCGQILPKPLYNVGFPWTPCDEAVEFSAFHVPLTGCLVSWEVVWHSALDVLLSAEFCLALYRRRFIV